MDIPDACIHILELHLDTIRIVLEVFADDQLQLGGIGGRGWRGCLAAAKTNDRRDGWIGQCLADKLRADKASGPSDGELHDH